MSGRSVTFGDGEFDKMGAWVGATHDGERFDTDVYKNLDSSHH